MGRERSDCMERETEDNIRGNSWGLAAKTDCIWF